MHDNRTEEKWDASLGGLDAAGIRSTGHLYILKGNHCIPWLNCQLIKQIANIISWLSFVFLG